MKISDDIGGDLEELEVRSLVIKTAAGRFRISESEDGGLAINGPGPANHTTHLIGLAVFPKSSNHLFVNYVPRTPRSGED